MTDHCYQPTEFDRLLELPAGHEDLDHLSGCTRCQDDLALYKSLLAPNQGQDPNDILAAHPRLLAFLKLNDEKKPEPLSLPSRKFGNLSRVAMLAAACLACAAIVVKFDFLGIGSQPLVPSGVVRDLTEDTSSWKASEKRIEGGFLLSWTEQPGADQYEILVLDTSLDQLDRFGVPATGEFQLLEADFSWLKDQAGPFFWSIVALQNGDELTRSPVRSLERGP